MKNRFMTILPRVPVLSLNASRSDGRRERQHDSEFGTAACPPVDRNLPAMDLDSPLGNRQAQPGTTAVARPRFVDAKEAMEDALAVLRCDPRPFVFDRQQGVAGGLLTRREILDPTGCT